MGNTEQPVTEASVADVRQAPLGKLFAVETLVRLRPVNDGKVAVAAFNASL